MANVIACVPVYEGEAFVARTLESLRSQTYQDLEILVSIDRCADRSAEACIHFAGDRRLRIMEQSRRLGFVGNVEYLLERAEGEFVFLMPHDDWIEPDYVEVLVRHLRAAPSAIAAYTDVERFGAAGGILHQPSLTGDRIERIEDFLRHHNNAVAFRGLMRRRLLPSPPALPRNPCEDFAADTAWLLSLACRGELHRVERVLYHKSIHDESQFHQWARRETRWHVEAWLEHCASCVTVALEHTRSDRERARVLEAARTRLTMPHQDLWPPNGVHGMGVREKEQLASRFEKRLREVLDVPSLPESGPAGGPQA